MPAAASTRKPPGQQSRKPKHPAEHGSEQKPFSRKRQPQKTPYRAEQKRVYVEVHDEKQVGINGHAFTSRHQYTCGTNFDSVTLCRREKFSEKAAERVLLAGFALTKSALPAMLKILLEVAFI